MFSWLSKSNTPAEAESAFDFDALLRTDVAVLFKHSPTCATSWFAQRHVDAFAAANPAIPVHTISVRDRELAREIAARTQVRHESPQVIVFRQGQVVAHTSHDGVTEEFLADAIGR
jgi:bacillithiol system protein YtxJ